MKPVSRYLIESILKHWNHYYAVLPYNLNWQRSLSTQERQFLAQNPIVVCDVGARGAAPEELAPLFGDILYYAFDADEEECNRLRQLDHPYRERFLFPYFIGSDATEVPFYLYKVRGESSPYRPGRRFATVFAGADFAVEREVAMSSISLDSFLASEQAPLPDFLKLDTQGSELEILQGASRAVMHASLIEVEAEFIEMYEGQPLFKDILEFMTANGFELLYLNRVFGHRTQFFTGGSRGQLVFGDALFGRREDHLADLSPAQIAKYVLLLRNYGHIDFANHLLLLQPDLKEQFPFLRHAIPRPIQGGRLRRFLLGRLKHTLLAQLDKLILILLHLRGHNRLTNDSDRSWPIR